VNRLETLLGSLRRCCETFPDPRRGGNTTYRIADIGMAAFSVFFMQRGGRGNSDRPTSGKSA
jgi:hypothetical protein